MKFSKLTGTQVKTLAPHYALLRRSIWIYDIPSQTFRQEERGRETTHKAKISALNVL